MGIYASQIEWLFIFYWRMNIISIFNSKSRTQIINIQLFIHEWSVKMFEEGEKKIDFIQNSSEIVEQSTLQGISRFKSYATLIQTRERFVDTNSVELKLNQCLRTK